MCSYDDRCGLFGVWIGVRGGMVRYLYLWIDERTMNVRTYMCLLLTYYVVNELVVYHYM